ncbi:cytosine permease, partial [Pantoea sp. EKM103V]
ACLFVFINLGSVCTHCLYNGAVGFSHLFSSKMRLWTLILGGIGGVLALAGVWSYFLEWLSLLGIVVPPFGAVMIVDLIFMARISEQRPAQRFRGTAFAAWAIGSLCAVIAHVAFPQFGEAVIGLVTAALSYSLISKLRMPRPEMENSHARLQR